MILLTTDTAQSSYQPESPLVVSLSLKREGIPLNGHGQLHIVIGKLQQ